MKPQDKRPQSRVGTWPVPEGAGTQHAVPGIFVAPSLLIGQLRQMVRAEAGPGRLMPWVPVAFGAGIALYFTASHEPFWPVVLLTSLIACGCAVVARWSRMFAALVLLAAAASGFAAATLKAAWVAHPVLSRSVYAERLRGFVETHEVREKSDRFVLRVTEMATRRGIEKLTRVRLTVRKGTGPPVGSFIELKARLSPPLTPLRPGGYDFARDLYFQGIGASGFALGRITQLAPPSDGGWRLRYAAAMQGMRDAIDQRISVALDGDRRIIATALLTGRRDAITPAVNDAMFISGIGHVLSISGYHMAVVAGVVFFALRALLALMPGLIATYRVKKLAAAAALAAATFYLLLSGAEVATQRSFFMTAVVLIAVIVDRRAITLRTLAIAAMLVLLMMPEAVVHPSFQMSFAATLGLVALIQFGMPRLLATPDNSIAAKVALWGGREVAMLAAASLIAGFATMPYAAFHFHRLAPYGVLTNLAAMPVVSALVMPAGLLGLIAMPFGLDTPFWLLMGVGIDWMVMIALWVAALPGAVGPVHAFGPGALLLMTLAILMMGMLRTSLRWLGIVPLLLGVVWAGAASRLDILVAADGRNVAVRGNDGHLRIMRNGNDAFTLRSWLSSDADMRGPADASLAAGVSCDDDGCLMAMRGGALVALTRRPEAFADDCARASVIVTAHDAPQGCGALVIDRRHFEMEGSHVLHQVAGGGFVIRAARPVHQHRPWFRGMTERSASVSRTAPRAQAGEGAASAEQTNKRRGNRSDHAQTVDATPPDTEQTGDD